MGVSPIYFFAIYVAAQYPEWMKQVGQPFLSAFRRSRNLFRHFVPRQTGMSAPLFSEHAQKCTGETPNATCFFRGPMPTLAYDALPAGSDLSRELTADGVTITASVREPSARSIRFIRRRAAVRAIPDCVIGVTIASLVVLLLLVQLNRRPNLPPLVFPIIAVFIAAIYLLAWKARFDTAINLLNDACSHLTHLVATAQELEIEIQGPRSSISRQIAASHILEIRPAPMSFRLWWAATLPVLRITLQDAEPIDVLPGRDEAELEAVAAMLRRALRVPEPVVKLY